MEEREWKKKKTGSKTFIYCTSTGKVGYTQIHIHELYKNVLYCHFLSQACPSFSQSGWVRGAVEGTAHRITSTFITNLPTLAIHMPSSTSSILLLLLLSPGRMSRTEWFSSHPFVGLSVEPFFIF